MSRPRQNEYIDIILAPKDVDRIKKGNTVHRWKSVNGNPEKIGIAIKMADQKISRKIAKLEIQLRNLKKQQKEKN